MREGKSSAHRVFCSLTLTKMLQFGVSKIVPLLTVLYKTNDGYCYPFQAKEDKKQAHPYKCSVPPLFPQKGKKKRIEF